jgi:CO dehydrogenase maturation factor
MSFLIAFAGKGGTGKTTLASLTIRYIIEKKRVPVLAVDADANSCLNEALGLEVHATVGGLREDSLRSIREGGDRPGGMSMEQIFDYQVQQSIVEAEGFDLIVMGRPEGPGCYCAANNIIRKYTDKLSASYPYVVVDNEAGMEHLSRRTSQKVDLLIIAADPSRKGLMTAKKINRLVDELGLDVRKRALIVNRVLDDTEDTLLSAAGESGLKVAGIAHEDPSVCRYEIEGRPLLKLPSDAPVVREMYSILDGLLSADDFKLSQRGLDE